MTQHTPSLGYLMPPQHCECGRELPCYDNHPLTACPDCGHDVDHTTPCPDGCPECSDAT